MSKEKLGIVFCTSQGGATRETFDKDLFRHQVLDPVYELLSTVPDVWQVLCVTPFDSALPESEVVWSEVASEDGVTPRVFTPTSHAVLQYSSTWPKGVCERLRTYNTPWKTLDDCMNDGIVSMFKEGATRIIVVPYGKQFPFWRHILHMLIQHGPSEPMVIS